MSRCRTEEDAWRGSSTSDFTDDLVAWAVSEPSVIGLIAVGSTVLALLWPDYQAGRITEQELETAAFTVFLLGRMTGAAAEIDDHLNRGRNMDTRTPASACRFVT